MDNSWVIPSEAVARGTFTESPLYAGSSSLSSASSVSDNHGFSRIHPASLIVKLQGYLLKKGDKGFVKSYKKRWFVLAANVMSYSKERDQAAIGVIMLDQHSVAAAEPGTEAEFQISNRYKKRVYYMQAINGPERDKWLFEITAAIRAEMSRPGSIHSNRNTTESVPSAAPAPTGIHTHKVISSNVSTPAPDVPPPMSISLTPPLHGRSNTARKGQLANAYGLAPMGKTTAFAAVRTSILVHGTSGSPPSGVTPRSAPGGFSPVELSASADVVPDEEVKESPPEITIDEGTTFTVDFGEAYKIETPSETYAVFAMEIHVGSYTYVLTRRYAEFRAMHDKLLAKYEGKIIFPPFPPKTPFKTAAMEIEKRRAMFAEYFKELLRLGNLQREELMLKFFGINVRERTATQKLLSVAPVQALPTVQLSKMAKQVGKLTATLEENGENGFEKEYAYIEAKSVADMSNLSFANAMLECNRTKNRYNNVLAPEHSRFQLLTLECEDGTFLEGSDYINANWIPPWVPGTTYLIAAQGPTNTTVFDFWRLLWESNAPIVVMLTNVVESGKLKCEPYWPEPCGPEERLQVFVFEIGAEVVSASQDLIVRKLTVKNIVTEEIRTITHYQFISWPDHGLPPSTASFLQLIGTVSGEVSLLLSQASEPGPLNVVVHCSAGIGRTGTFCFIYYILEKLAADIDSGTTDPTFSVGEYVLNMRQHRPGMVQTKEQYTFCYLALLEASKTMLNYGKEVREQTLTNIMQEVSSSQDLNANNSGKTGNSDLADLDALLFDLESIKAKQTTIT